MEPVICVYHALIVATFCLCYLLLLLPTVPYLQVYGANTEVGKTVVVAGLLRAAANNVSFFFHRKETSMVTIAPRFAIS